jgi:hypothetical protein
MNDDLTPADLARELGIDPKRIRQFLRAEWGKLPPYTTRWSLTEEQARRVRQRFS